MRILAEGPGSQTIETDDGRIVVVPSGLLAPQGALPPPTAGVVPQSISDFLSPPPARPGAEFTPGELPVADPAAAFPPAAPAVTPRVAAAGPGGAPAAPAVQPQPQAAVGVPGGAPVPVAAQEGVAALEQQQQAQQGLADIESQELAATGGLLTEGQFRRQAIADEAAAARQRDFELLEKRTAELSSMIDEQAKTPVDPDRRYKSQTVGDRIAIAIGAMLAGVGQAMMGQAGPNPVIEQIRADVESDIRAQMADRDERARKIGMLGQQVDRYRTVASDRGALFKARLGEEMERLAQEVEINAATYGSEKAKANAALIAGQFRAKKAEYVQGAIDAQFANDLATRKQTEVERSARAGERLQGWSIAESSRRAKEDLQYKYAALQVESDRLDAAGRSAEATALRAAAKEAFEKEIPNTKTKSGDTVKGRTKEEAVKLRETQAGVEAGARAIDEIVNILQTGGPPTDILKSPEWQRIKSNEGALISAINQALLGGVVREGDIAFVQKTFQGGGLTGIEAMIRDGLGNSAAEGLLKTRQVLERGFSDKLRSHDSNALPYTVPPLTGLAPSRPGPVGDAFKRAVAGQTPEEIRRGGERSTIGEIVANSPPGLAARGISEGLFGSSKGPEGAEKIAARSSGFTLPTVGEDQEKDLLALGRRAGAGDADARAALLSLGASGRPGLAQGAILAAAEGGDLATVDAIAAANPKAAEGHQLARARGIAAGTQVGRIADKARSGDVEAQRAILSLAQSADPDIKREAGKVLAELVGKRGK